jgi:Domain of unknown function (DUF3303)
MKKYIVIEKFRPGKARILYERFREKGRMLPDGVTYIDSWIDEPVTVCYQLMEAESPELLEQWTAQWKDLAEFDLIPVISSQAASEKIFSAR